MNIPNKETKIISPTTDANSLIESKRLLSISIRLTEYANIWYQDV